MADLQNKAETTLLEVRNLQIGAMAYPPGERPLAIEIVKGVSFTLERGEARVKAREWFEKYPKAAYWTQAESWRQLPGDRIEFTMRRLPSAD